MLNRKRCQLMIISSSVWLMVTCLTAPASETRTTLLRGEVVDADTKAPSALPDLDPGGRRGLAFPQLGRARRLRGHLQQTQPVQPVHRRDAHDALGASVSRSPCRPGGTPSLWSEARNITRRPSESRSDGEPSANHHRAEAMDRHAPSGLVLGRNPRPPHGRGTAEPDAGRGSEHRVPARRLGARGVRGAAWPAVARRFATPAPTRSRSTRPTGSTPATPSTSSSR